MRRLLQHFGEKHPDQKRQQQQQPHVHRREEPSAAEQGRLEPAFEHYRRALALNPQHRGAHEYAGEAYLLAGNLAKAEEHLEALRRICLVPCEELIDLEREITAYRTQAGGQRR